MGGDFGIDCRGAGIAWIAESIDGMDGRDCRGQGWQRIAEGRGLQRAWMAGMAWMAWMAEGHGWQRLQRAWMAGMAEGMDGRGAWMIVKYKNAVK
jgi:hypothetical protein